MSRLTTETSIMGRKHDLRYGCAKNWKKVERYYLIENAVDKLGAIEDLEESIGIDLIILFKAIYKGIYFDCDDFKKNFTSRPRLYYSDDFKCYCFEISFGSWVVKLKDYKKNWWLKEDLEDVNTKI